MPIFKPVIGTRSKVQAAEINDGSYYVTSDTGQVFIDLDNSRLHINSLDADENVINMIKQIYAKLGIMIVEQDQVLNLSQKKITLDQEAGQVQNNTLTMG